MNFLAVLAFTLAPQHEQPVADLARLPYLREGKVVSFTSDGPAVDPIRAEEEGTVALARILGHQGRIARIWLRGGHPRAKLRAYFDGRSVPAFTERLATGFDEGRPPLLSFWTFSPERAAGARVSYPPLLFLRDANLTISSKVDAFEIDAVLDEPAELAALPEVPNTASFDLPAVEVAASQAKLLGEADGEGTLTELTLLPDGFADDDYANLRLHIFVDGEKTPSVDAPLDQLFARPKNSIHPDTQAFSVTEREMKLQLPVPFSGGCRVEVENKGSRPLRLHATAQVSRDRLHPKALRLHAAEWRGTSSRSTPVEIASLAGRGHWIGFTCRALAKATTAATGGGLSVVSDGAPAYRSLSFASAFDGGDKFGEATYATIGSGVAWLADAAFGAYHLRVSRPLPYRASLRAELRFPSDAPVSVSGATFWYEKPPGVPSSAAVGASSRKGEEKSAK